MQNLIVYLIVVLAAVYAGWKFLPAALRRRWAAEAAGLVAASGRVSETNVKRIESKLASGGACGSCDSCKACSTSNLPANENRDAFASIPIIKINA